MRTHAGAHALAATRLFLAALRRRGGAAAGDAGVLEGLEHLLLLRRAELREAVQLRGRADARLLALDQALDHAVEVQRTLVRLVAARRHAHEDDADLALLRLLAARAARGAEDGVGVVGGRGEPLRRRVRRALDADEVAGLADGAGRRHVHDGRGRRPARHLVRRQRRGLALLLLALAGGLLVRVGGLGARLPVRLRLVAAERLLGHVAHVVLVVARQRAEARDHLALVVDLLLRAEELLELLQLQAAGDVVEAVDGLRVAEAEAAGVHRLDPTRDACARAVKKR